jgi:CheY-like chemotaxis protein
MTPTVLIVEDSENAAVALEIAIGSIEGLAVQTLGTAQEALNTLSADRSNVVAIVTDLHLPVMDGFALIEEIRRTSSSSKLPIVVVSGDTHPDSPARCLRLGANAYFAKPFSPNEICRTLEGLLHAP